MYGFPAMREKNRPFYDFLGLFLDFWGKLLHLKVEVDAFSKGLVSDIRSSYRKFKSWEGTFLQLTFQLFYKSRATFTTIPLTSPNFPSLLDFWNLVRRIAKFVRTGRGFGVCIKFNVSSFFYTKERKKRAPDVCSGVLWSFRNAVATLMSGWHAYRYFSLNACHMTHVTWYW